MADDSKKPGPIKALFLILAAGVLYLVQQFTGLDLLSKKDTDDPSTEVKNPIEAPAEQAPKKEFPKKKVAEKQATKKKTPDKPASDDGYAVVKSLFEAGTSDAWIECAGEVVHILPTDNYGSRHQQFLVEVGGEITLKIAHNIDLAKVVPIAKGDWVSMKGEYEWNEKGGVLHWTHHNPSPNPVKPGGWIEHKGVLYK